MRTLVIGSKNLSVGILHSLVDQGHEVLGVITRDLESGMKVWHEKLGHKSLHVEAKKLGIAVHEGINVNSEECKALLRQLSLDIIFSCFWGQIIHQDVLDIPRLGIYNLHTAYLPLNRGSRPIPWSLIRNHSFTGLTIHKMNVGVDNGPIVSQIKIPIKPEDNAFTLYNKVTEAGLILFQKTLPDFANCTFQLKAQVDDQATYQPRGEPYGGQINLDWDQDQKERLKRAFTFPPFRSYRNAPSLLGRTPKAYFVMDQKLEAIHLDGKKSEYKINSIGDRAIRKRIKAQISSIEGAGVQVNFMLENMYPVHDVFIHQSINFVVSQVTSESNWSQRKEITQPFRYENGLLEIPSTIIENPGIIEELLNQGNTRALNENRDIFISLIPSNDSHFNEISNEISSCGAQQLTFTEVYHHFDTDYEYFSTSSI